jgi:hypothetical protein
MDFGTGFWIAAAIGALLVGMSKGGMPVVAMLSVPILSVVMDPAAAAGLLLPVYIFSDMFGLWLYRHQFSGRNLAILIPASAIGVLVGFLTVAIVTADAVKLAVAAVGFYYLGFRLLRRLRKEIPPHPADVPRGLFWGSIAGFTSYIAHAGGPPFQAYVLPQKLPKMIFAGTSTILFTVINLMKLPPYVVAGQITWESFGTLLYLGPLAAFGAWAGYRLIKLIPEKTFFVIIEVALFAVSVRLLVDGLT